LSEGTGIQQIQDMISAIVWRDWGMQQI
jgi:hypothetical protein